MKEKDERGAKTETGKEEMNDRGNEKKTHRGCIGRKTYKTKKYTMAPTVMPQLYEMETRNVYRWEKTTSKEYLGSVGEGASFRTQGREMVGNAGNTSGEAG